MKIQQAIQQVVPYVGSLWLSARHAQQSPCVHHLIKSQQSIVGCQIDPNSRIHAEIVCSLVMQLDCSLYNIAYLDSSLN